ncbi:probable magnesium transporter NIPA6 [Henckelia pumila]|uniref:probable magnesium transporter NIPA6 n=1 Tax=Henckelia pumila TaxID=405737 RepID=UPI003C6E512C
METPVNECVGGYTYLLEPLWWAGMITMIGGELANFVAYIYAPAVLVTPLGALSIIISAVLAHFMLRERLQKMGILGCISCIVGSVIIVIHAPQEQTPTSVQQVWILAIQPEFMIYVAATVSIVLALTLHFEPLYRQTNIVIYLGICSLMGALTVVSIKAMGIAIKLTLEGINQFTYAQTWFFLSVAVICVITQLNYLNKALDTFNAAIVSPIYYVMFTTLTIIASAIMFKELELFNSNKERKGRKQAIWKIVKVACLHLELKDQGGSFDCEFFMLLNVYFCLLKRNNLTACGEVLIFIVFVLAVGRLKVMSGMGMKQWNELAVFGN